MAMKDWKKFKGVDAWEDNRNCESDTLKIEQHHSEGYYYLVLDKQDGSIVLKIKGSKEAHFKYKNNAIEFAKDYMKEN
jgi:hypothetical protein